VESVSSPPVDVVVVGAGPAGCAAAITAARAGGNVVMIDRAEFPRDKCCGDGLTTDALRLLEELGVDPTTLHSWTEVSEAVVSSPSHREVVFPLPHGRGVFAAVARRAELDACLVSAARSAGATVVEGDAVIAATQDDDGVTIETMGGRSFRADFAVAADGMWSPMRKLLGVGPSDYLGDWHAFRQYFTGVSDRAERELRVWFEPDFLPGYAWSFPLGDGQANVGFGIQRGSSYTVRDMKHLWPDILERPTVRAWLGESARAESPHKAWPIPARVGDVALSSGRVLFVGDAAAASDPLTGEGIAQALSTGMWAVEAMLEAGGHDPLPARAAYERRVRAELAVDHRLSKLLIRAMRHRKGARAAVWLASLTPWTRRNFALWLFEDYPRAVLLTPSRWRSGMLAGRGAFAGDSTDPSPAATLDP
jgi:geranylgeranyl reductase family protein